MYELQCRNFRSPPKTTQARRRKTKKPPAPPRPVSLPQLAQRTHMAAKDGIHVHDRRKIHDIAGRLGADLASFRRPSGEEEPEFVGEAQISTYGCERITLPHI
jgi:hypothetical protein